MAMSERIEQMLIDGLDSCNQKAASVYEKSDLHVYADRSSDSCWF